MMIRYNIINLKKSPGVHNDTQKEKGAIIYEIMPANKCRRNARIRKKCQFATIDVIINFDKDLLMHS